MTFTATYTDATASIALACTSIPTGADTVLFERSTDQVTWTQVRSGAAVPVATSAAGLTDYEYVAGTTNYYRASYVDAALISFLSAGAASTGNNTSLTPALPGSLLVGDLMLCLASIRNVGTGTPNTPAGWTKVVDGGNVVLLSRRYVAGDTAPTITFAGGAAGADTIAQVAAFRNAALMPVTSVAQANVSTQNINTPAISWAIPNVEVLQAGWKQAVSTGSTLTARTQIANTSSSAGSGATQTWFYAAGVVAGGIIATAITVTGGSAAVSEGLVAVLQQAAYMTQDTATVTPAQSTVWLKSPLKPFLNRPITVVGVDKITRASRSGVFDVIGRSYPVGVIDVTGSRQTTLLVRTTDRPTADDLETVLSVGDVWLISAPQGARTPTMYAVMGNPDMDYAASTSPVRRFTLPLTEVAQPDLALTYTLSTYATVLGTYATYAALLAAKATYADVLLLVGSPADVVVS